MKKAINKEAPPAEAPIVRQYFDELAAGPTPTWWPFTVDKPFRLKVKKGPAVGIPVGAKCELYSPILIADLFVAGKISPVPSTPAGEEWIVTTPNTIILNGEYTHLKVATILRLTQTEALSMLRRGLIKPVNEEKDIFHLGLLRPKA